MTISIIPFLHLCFLNVAKPRVKNVWAKNYSQMRLIMILSTKVQTPSLERAMSTQHLDAKNMGKKTCICFQTT
jgi:hypothetical protein